MRGPLALLVLAALAWAEHETIELESPGQIDYRVIRDLDGDGIDDLLIVNGKEAWFWRGRKGRPAAAPDAKMSLPDGTALFDVGPAAGLEAACVVRTSKAYWALVPGKSPLRLSHASGPGLPLRAVNVLWRGFFGDFDLDRKTDFVDVSLDGYRLTYAAGGSVTLPPRLLEDAETSAVAASGRFIARHALGQWTGGNFNGDLRPDFAVVGPEGLLVYTGDASGRVDPSRTLKLPLAEAAEADLSFLDFNRDGQTDLLAVSRKAGKATIVIADRSRGLAHGRRSTLALPGEMRYPIVTDLDADGLVDLALPYLPRITVQDAVRVFMRSEVLIKVPFFLNRGGEACFGSVADNQVTLPVRVRIGTDSAGRIQLSGLIVVEYEGDWDGDGRRDLLVTRRTDLLGVHRGVRSGVFHEDVHERVPIPDCAEFDSVKSAAADLNGDGRSDIILHYRGGGRLPDKLYLLWSRKN